MVFEGKTLETMGEIFNTALDVAKTGNSDRCQEFLTSYVEYIVSESNLNVAEAENIAKSNLGYFAGYYDRDVYNAINKAYGAVHPVFGGNPFDISPEEVYNWGLEARTK
jgi:hypothetical protein